MEIGSPLHTLDIIGGETRSILKLNQTEWIAKGTRDHVLSIRDEILTNRGYIVPEDWDTSWNVHLGPIWTPAQLGSTVIKCWLSPEYLHPSSGDANDVAEAEDRSGNEIKFNNTYVEANQPHFSAELNGFQGIDFDGSNDVLFSDDEAGDDEFDVGTDDFYFMLMLKHGTDVDTQKYILCSDYVRDFTLAARSTSINFNYKSYYNQSPVESNQASIAWAPGDYGIVGAGRESSNRTLRSYTDTSTGSGNLYSGTSTGDMINASHFALGARQHALTTGLSTANWDGELYELIFYHGTISEDDREKIEGYLAHKYAKTDLLESDHPYKTNPPRSPLQE